MTHPATINEYLLQAIHTGDTRLTASALARGADPNTLYAGPTTPLREAISHRHFDITQQLLASGARLQDFLPGYSSPLHLACHISTCEIARFLLSQAGSNLAGLISPLGRSLMHEAALGKKFSLFSDLLNRGIAIDGMDKSRFTPLHLAAIGRSPESIRELCQLGASPDSQDATGNTPLHLAAELNDAAGVSTLLRFGADPRLANSANELPIDIARRQPNNFTVLKMLEIAYLPDPTTRRLTARVGTHRRVQR